ncbi:PaaI family thioesterase [Parvularcula sp. ZS-1/3]|uniref:PaaI family thioesterase n=1 Tax=Parvularcula mediterranea TaxID=2732508 RepID=A0A7Y3W5C9_9PROT|nr:PaaI family thioesterase [Parvularcula mediterranea]NNU16388.1 PaaI family thioesterase [Parvularcula mediterranea]
MSDQPQPLAPAVAMAFEGIQNAFMKEHPLFTQMAPKPLRVGRGELIVRITPTETFLDGDGVHSGLMTILLDTVMGMATWADLDEFSPLATINLQTDVYENASVGKHVIIEATCEGIRDDVSIVRGKATSEDGTLLATGAGTFMVGTRSAQVSRI